MVLVAVGRGRGVKCGGEKEMRESYRIDGRHAVEEGAVNFI